MCSENENIGSDFYTNGHPNREQTTIAFILLPEQSAYNATFALAKTLKKRGYRVIYVGPDKYFTHVLAQKLEYYVVRLNQGVWTLNYPTLSRNRRICLKRKNFYTDLWDSFSEYEYVLTSQNVNLILLDSIFSSLTLPALKSRIPVLIFNTSLASTFNFRCPPVFSGLSSKCNPAWLSVFRNALVWIYYLARPWYRIQQGKLYWLRAGVLPPRSFSKSVKKLGGKVNWTEYGPRLDTAELIASPMEFDFPQSNFKRPRIYIGSCVDVTRREIDVNCGELDVEKPLLYCSLGTYSHAYPYSDRLFKVVIDVLRKRHDLQAILQIGSAKEVESFGLLPPRIKLLKEAPQLQILSKTDIFITHGGLSSVREAIHFGVPMLVFPCWNDQPGNAARVVVHGLGLRGNIRTINHRSLFKMLDEIKDPRFKQALSKMQVVFQRQQSCDLGANFVEKYFH